MLETKINKIKKKCNIENKHKLNTQSLVEMNKFFNKSLFICLKEKNNTAFN